MLFEDPRKTPRNGRVITFYSYKGGVGRSMALANIGVILAQASANSQTPTRVLLVDWDLEAPGLEKYFTDKPQVSLSCKPEDAPGIVDLIVAKDAGRPLNWHDCIVTAKMQGVSVDLIISGRQGGDQESRKSYAQQVQSLNWPHLFENADIGRYFDQLRNEWMAEYDFILIDSRTGITDIGDICTVIMPDILVPLFVTNAPVGGPHVRSGKRVHRMPDFAARDQPAEHRRRQEGRDPRPKGKAILAGRPNATACGSGAVTPRECRV